MPTMDRARVAHSSKATWPVSFSSASEKSDDRSRQHSCPDKSTRTSSAIQGMTLKIQPAWIIVERLSVQENEMMPSLPSFDPTAQVSLPCLLA
jgi:hypothetical protein